MKIVEKLSVMAKGRRILAGFLAAVLTGTGMGFPFPFPVQASDVWPQKSTAPFYCIDGGKGWKKTDRYNNYKYDTLPAPLTKVQAKRLFWAYPSNWKALKEAAKTYDPSLYTEIASTSSGPNTVKYVKDNAGTKFAWIADNPEIEERAIAVMEQASAEGAEQGKEAPDEIREATSEEKAVPFQVLPFSDGPAALDTEFVLGSEFIRDIAKIEPQSVWDNGSGGGTVGWLDASQDKNIAKSVMGENLYEVTWSGDSIKIHNNGSVTANENAVGSSMSEEEKYNKTTVRYKITMRGGSGWYTEGSWSEDYLHEWMDFKACINAPNHQRLYKADIRITPSDQVFYLVISQDGEWDGDVPEYGVGEPELEFQVFRHEEVFEANYNVRLKKYDDETGMPLKGSQFYLYERFEDGDRLGDHEKNGNLAEKNLSFTPWEGFQIFAEATTDEKGEITYRDTRSYSYSKTYCDGHGMPKWAEMETIGGDGESGEEQSLRAGEDEEGDSPNLEASREQVKDKNRAAAQAWLDLVSDCEDEAEGGEGTHFHWLSEEDALDIVTEVLESGEPEEGSLEGSGGSAGARQAFEQSGCRADCEETYQNFIALRFTYTWKEIQARPGYILHGLHEDSVPIELVTTVSSEAGAKAVITDGNSSQIHENIWYGGGRETDQSRNKRENDSLVITEEAVKAFSIRESSAKQNIEEDLKQQLLRSASNGRRMQEATPSDSQRIKEDSLVVATDSNAFRIQPFSERIMARLLAVPTGDDDYDWDDSEWEEAGDFGDFSGALESAEIDDLPHLDLGDSGRFSHCGGTDNCGDSWRVYDHRTEGRIHINKRDLDLYRKEGDSYSSYGETEGDSTLEGAVYGLFAAENIIHPDAEVAEDGTITNTGIVYRKNDLAAVAATDQDGNADFLAYTAAPGMTYDYESGKIQKSQTESWDGPKNLYDNNLEGNGNYWIGRPLILGNYYVKELSRSEGFELSVNGITQARTNSGTGFETPDSVVFSKGTMILTLPELSAAMEGEDGGGKGYDELPFSVTSTGTGGYEIFISGIPDGAEFFRVDTGEDLVTGPHVTGTEEKAVTDDAGNPIWVTAESDSSNVCYEPEYGDDGKIIGQIPMSRIEDQIIKAEQIPEKKPMEMKNIEVDEGEPFFSEKIRDLDLTDEKGQAFCFIKAETEEILSQNGYEVPATFEGIGSTRQAPVFSRGVRKGETDSYEMTAAAGSPALRTVYGAATAEVTIPVQDPETTAADFIGEILKWYQSHPEWSYGGIDRIAKEDGGYRLTLYAGASNKDSRRFFTMKEEGGKLIPDRIYTVHENPKELRWVYQIYESKGEYSYKVDRQYYMGGGDRRYYMDATLTPAVLVNSSGILEPVRHQVMVYHSEGEEIIDYLSGDSGAGYRVPLTETVDKIEITTELEQTEKDVKMEKVSYDKQTGQYRISVETEGEDSFGKAFTDDGKGLTLQFSVKLPQKKVILTEEDIGSIGAGNVWGYHAGDEIGAAQYFMRFAGVSLTVSASEEGIESDTYIVARRLVYRGQTRISESGDTDKIPLQVLECPIKQKVKVKKEVENEKGLENFRFKIYLLSNLENLFCDETGEIQWLNKDGKPIDPKDYKNKFPELVPKFYTKETGRRILEEKFFEMEDGNGKLQTAAGYNYEKFFQGIWTANQDLWHREGEVVNTSYKPAAAALFTGIRNQINSSFEAAENAKRSDAVRQFAVDWYLEEEVEKITVPIPGRDGIEAADGGVVYPDEIYDRALYQAVLKAEEYLKPFFLYDLDSLYEILWDSEEKGGIDGDFSTLSADQIIKGEKGNEYAIGISEYLPYGRYVLSEQQPFCADYMDYPNRHYKIDAPKILDLPAVYEAETENESSVPELSSQYVYRKEDTPNTLAKKYLIRFNEEWADNHEENLREYIISAHNNDGDFEIYPYGLDQDRTEGHYEPYGNPEVAKYYHYNSVSENGSVQDQVPFTGGPVSEENQSGLYFKDGVRTMTGMKTAYDGKYAPMLVPWSVTDPQENEGEASKEDLSGYGIAGFFDRLYQVRLRIEKLDLETGEPILHDDAVFGLYKAEHEKNKNGTGEVKRYEKDTVISGSREFLEAMGAEQITPLARNLLARMLGAGEQYSGMVKKGTPICKEEDVIIFSDSKGVQTGEFCGLSTVTDEEKEGILQTTGFFETPEPVPAGVYVLAELKVPAGYVRSGPIPIEVYSDAVSYYPNGGAEKAAAVIYPYELQKGGNKPENKAEAARIYVNDTAVGLEVSKKKTSDAYRGMKISGRVEGTVTSLAAEYGLENLELAYNSSGTYQGFGWKKGTLEYLENRKKAGERVQLVYDNNVFQGYGYVTRALETSEHQNRYVAGAKMALFEGIEISPSGDSEDFAFEGVEIFRDRNGNVTEILVKEGYAGERTEFVCKNELWSAKTIQRKDTPVLFYELGGLQVIEKDKDGVLYGYDRDGKKMRITNETDSIYALKGGKPVFELWGGDFSRLTYDNKEKAFTKKDPDTMIYHLDEELCRDSQVDGYTGLAYLERYKKNSQGKETKLYYVWPVTVTKDGQGKTLAREKILTGRPGEIQAGTENAYITGTWKEDTKMFDKEMDPVYDEFGLVKYYQKSDDIYGKGEKIYDRDGDYIRYRYDDLLETYNRAAYAIKDHEELFNADSNGETFPDHTLNHRYGEAYLIPNLWISGEATPQDQTDSDQTKGQPDLLRRVVPGVYMMEELEAPSGYAKAMPLAVCVEEIETVQRVAMTDERIKVEISKVDSVDNYKIFVDKKEGEYSEKIGIQKENEWTYEGSGRYSNTMISGAEMAIFKARRVLTTDFETYPNGYYFVKAESTPFVWNVENSVDNSLISTTGQWTSGGHPKYLEGLPAGDYILEELKAPPGYLPTTMEFTVKETDKLQSFVLNNDHTKLEIDKYVEMGGERKPLPCPLTAELTLYPAILDIDGNAIVKDGQYQYETERPMDSWLAKDQSAFFMAMKSEYENLYSQYGGKFTEFSWTERGKEEETEYHAVLKESESYGNSEILNQIWEIDNGEEVRITAVKNDGRASLGEDRRPQTQFEYQLQYKKGDCEEFPELVSYDTEDGIHRIDRIPTGAYVLVETKTPSGYETAAPMLIMVEEKSAVQRYGLKNERGDHEMPDGELKIEKRNSKKEPLSGAWFEVENKQTGEIHHMVTGDDGTAVLGGLPSGIVKEDGTEEYYQYEIKEIKPPKGYCLETETREISFGEMYFYRLLVENEETNIRFSKSDFQTGHFVPGAVLAVYEAVIDDGKYFPGKEALERWESSENPHQVTGKLIAGKKYFLVEESAPQGYGKANPVLFTISSDGRGISEVTEDNRVIKILRKPDSEEIEALLMPESSVREVRYEAFDGEKKLLEWTGTGKERVFDETEVDDGTNLTIRETVVFIDGREFSAKSYTFRLRFGEGGNNRFQERIPVNHEFYFKTGGGRLLETWKEDGRTEYRIENRKKEDGEFLLKAGETYRAGEALWFSDGGYIAVSDISLSLGQNGGVSQVDLKNREILTEISKTDMVTGEELPGAELTLWDSSGNIVEQWVSGDAPHVMTGTLEAGGTYILEEKSAPDGYEIAEKVTFTISEEGEIHRVEMEDRREEEPDEPDEPDTPKPEEPTPEEPEPEKPAPEEPVPEIPRKPTPAPPVPEPVPEEPVKKIGKIYADYEIKRKGDGELRLKQKDKYRISNPKTSDDINPVLYVLGMVGSAAALIYILRKKGKECEK